MDARKVRENFGRIKVYYQKGDTIRAVGHAVVGLKALGGATPPTDVRGSIREGIQLLSRDEGLKAVLGAPLVYQPGQEKNLLVVLSKAYAALQGEMGKESREEALARKQKLDQALNTGKKLLEQDKPSEADAAFQEAVGHYRDEHRAFYMMGKMMLDANQPRRAYPYLKKAVELEPENQDARNQFALAAQAREGAKSL